MLLRTSLVPSPRSLQVYKREMGPGTPQRARGGLRSEGQGEWWRPVTRECWATEPGPEVGTRAASLGVAVKTCRFYSGRKSKWGVLLQSKLPGRVVACVWSWPTVEVCLACCFGCKMLISCQNVFSSYHYFIWENKYTQETITEQQIKYKLMSKTVAMWWVTKCSVFCIKLLSVARILKRKDLTQKSGFPSSLDKLGVGTFTWPLTAGGLLSCRAGLLPPVEHGPPTLP